VLDTFVAAQLRPQLALSRLRPRFYHLRTEEGRHEVDLVGELAGRRVVGIEVKASAAPTMREDARHLACWLTSLASSSWPVWSCTPSHTFTGSTSRSPLHRSLSTGVSAGARPVAFASLCLHRAGLRRAKRLQIGRGKYSRSADAHSEDLLAVSIMERTRSILLPRDLSSQLHGDERSAIGEASTRPATARHRSHALWPGRPLGGRWQKPCPETCHEAPANQTLEKEL
jgi:hypothetical protein